MMSWLLGINLFLLLACIPIFSGRPRHLSVFCSAFVGMLMLLRVAMIYDMGHDTPGVIIGSSFALGMLTLLMITIKFFPSFNPLRNME